MRGKGNSKSNKGARHKGGKSRGKGKPPKPRGKRGRGARKRPLQLIDREATERSTLSVTLSDNAGETVSHRKPLSWRSAPRKRSAEAKERRELHFQQREQTAQQLRTAQREQTAQQLRTTRAKCSAKSQRTAVAPQCSGDRSEAANRIFWEVVQRRSAASGSADPQPLTPLSPHCDSEHSSWGQQEQEEESSESEADFLQDEVVVPEEADTTGRLKQELKEEIAAFQAQKQPEQLQPSPTRTDDLPDFSPELSPDEEVVPEEVDTTEHLQSSRDQKDWRDLLAEEIRAAQSQQPEIAATPAVAASRKRPAEEPAGAASSSEPAQRQCKHEFDC